MNGEPHRPRDHFVINIKVEIQKLTDGSYTSDRLHTTEEFRIDAASFAELAAILGQFHDLADRVRANQT